MKIFYSITKSEIGGAQTYLWSLLKRAEENNDEAVVMSYPGGWLEGKVKELGFNFIPNKYFKNSFNPVNLLRAIIETRKEIKKFNPDIVHSNSGGAGFFTRLASIGLQKKVIFTAHGWSFTEGTPFFRRTIAKIGENIMTFLTDKIICVSQNDANLAGGVLIGSSGKIEVVHNGVKISDRFINLEKQEKIKAIFVGRLVRPKMPMVVLRVISKLPKELKDKITFTIVGFGEQEKDLNVFIKENSLENNVNIKNSVDPERRFEEYFLSNLFILPTQWEGFPITIIEAMASGLPVVASNVGGIKEIVDDSVGKLLTKGNEEDEIMSVFKEIFKNPDWFKDRGFNARKRVEQNFSSEKMCEEIWKIYEQA